MWSVTDYACKQNATAMGPRRNAQILINLIIFTTYLG